MMEILLGLLFWVALVGAVSTHLSSGKRWWGTRGFRVRMVRRNCWIGVGLVLVLFLAVYLPESEPANRSLPAPPATNAAAVSSSGARPATNALALPTPEVEATAESHPGNANAGDYCGTERWPVKTLSDEDRLRVNLRPVPATVAELGALPRPPLLLDNHRAPPGGPVALG